MTNAHDTFEELVSRHQGAVCAIAYSVLRDRGLSEECAQEAFLIAWQKLPGMSPAPVLPGWVCGIARNLARNAARRRRETEMHVEPHTESTPLDSLLDREAGAIATRALAGLSAHERDAVILYYRGEQSTAEVARALGITEEAAKKRIARGRAHLRSEVTAVEATLRSTRPGPAFTASCVAALAAGGAARASASVSKDATAWPAWWPAIPVAIVVASGWIAIRHAEPSPQHSAAPHRAAPSHDRVEPEAVWSGLSRPISRTARAGLTARIRAARNARVAAAAAASGSAPTAASPAAATEEQVRVYDFAGRSLFEAPTLDPPRKPGPLTKSDLRHAIQSVQPMLLECYTSAADQLSRRDGTITVVVRLEGEPDVGSIVASTRLEGDAYLIESAELAECFRETLSSIELPGLEDGGVVEIHYPLVIPPVKP